MKYEEIEKILEKYGFFAFIVKRKGNQLTYTYRSIAYYAVLLKVSVIKVNPETFGCKKLVGRITINGKEINDLKELVNTLKNVYKLQKEERVKLFKKI